MDIRARQNSPWSLDRLAAQRWLYGQAKRVESWRMMSVLAIAGLLLLGLAVEAQLYSQLATMIVVALWFLDQVVLVQWADSRKEEAATIQEDFDCFVLDLPWPEYSGVGRPTDDRVRELVRMSGKREANKELIDWYSGDDIPAEATAARLHCQTANCRWDGRLRKEWICAVISVASALTAAGLIVAALAGVSLLQMVLATAAVLRLAAWLLTEIRAQLAARRRIETLRGFLSRAGEQAGKLTVCDIRLVQVSIFQHRRYCPMVPDWFYRFRRMRHEALEGG